VAGTGLEAWPIAFSLVPLAYFPKPSLQGARAPLQFIVLAETNAPSFGERTKPPHMNHPQSLSELLGEYGAQESATRLTEALTSAGTVSTVCELLVELGEASRKVAREAGAAMVDLDRRAGLGSVVSWLDLGVVITQCSGAAGLNYFRESPRFVALIEPEEVRGQALAVMLEVAERDPHVALECVRKAPELLRLMSVKEFAAWAEVGAELVRMDYVVGIEFFKQSSAVAAVLPLSQVRSWVAFGAKLVTQNTLGKPDYIATLEFFRTSPAILGDIEGVDVRSLVVSVGSTLAEQDPQNAILFLAESPLLMRRMPSQEWAKQVLNYGNLVADRDPESALKYLRRCPEILSLGATPTTEKATFDQWFKGGMEVLDYSVEGARAYFGLETKRALESIEQAMSGVPLRTVARSLKLFTQALCRTDVSIQSLPESQDPAISGTQVWPRATVTEGGRTMLLPSRISRFPTREENIRLYTVMVAHEAGHLEFGTYRLDFENLQDLLSLVHRRYHGGSLAPTEAVMEPSWETLQDLFRLYPHPRLIQDLWTIVEDARVDYLLQDEYPGLRADLVTVAREAVTTRTLTHGLSVREMVVDTLLLLSTADHGTVPIHESITEIVQESWAQVQTILFPLATAEASVRLADSLYVLLEERVGSLAGEQEGQGETGEQDTDQGAGPPSSEGTGGSYQPVSNWAHRGVMDPGLIRNRSTGGHTESEDTEGGPESGFRVPDPTVGPADREGFSPRTGHQERESPRDEPSVGSQEGSTPDSWADQLVVGADARVGRDSVRPLGDAIYWYDEWDGIIKDYRSKWCRVVERDGEEGSPDFAEEVLNEHATYVRMLRRYFESIRPPGLRRIRGQADGEELDLDAAVLRHVDQIAGADPTERIYIRREKLERNVAVAFLVDLSGSTSRQVNAQGRRVIDVEKEGLILLGEALESIGDQFAVYGYSGRGRDQVDVLVLKDFEESGTRRYRGRVGMVTPLHQNRDGAAIRHITRKLLERPAKVRVLMLLSDGKPLDDGYADEYSLEDTKMALREARAQGVEPFCLTVDAQADEYVRRMYGEVRCLVIDRIDALPERLPRVYQRLTT